jgi:hypothetical protein
MNWIRKTVVFVSLLILAFFASQESNVAMHKNESKKRKPILLKIIPIP